jgi:CRISPR type I-E-associated protein CasB/Cse2
VSEKPETGPPPDLAGAIIRAWRTLYPDPERGWRGDPGGRAALRRAATPEAVLVEQAFHDLLAMIRETGALSGPDADARLYRRIAIVIALLCERRGDASGSRPFASALGGSSKPEERRFKTLRFQALIAALDRDHGADALGALRRALKLLGDEPVDLHRLVRDLLRWRDRTRIEWTFAYFGQQLRPDGPAAKTPEIEEQAT